MEWIFCTVGVIILLTIIIAFTLYFTLRKSSQISKSSIYIVNSFEPDNTASKITELIEFHRANDKIKYIVD